MRAFTQTLADKMLCKGGQTLGIRQICLLLIAIASFSMVACETTSPAAADVQELHFQYRDYGAMLQDSVGSKSLAKDISDAQNDVYGELYSLGVQTGTIFDVGAKVGVYSILLAKLHPFARVFAFEPDSEKFKHLQANLVRNQINNVVAMNVGLGDTDDDGTHGDRDRVVGGGEILALEEVMRVVNVSCVDFMRIDCDGCEHQLFASGSQKAKDLDAIDMIRGSGYDQTNALSRAVTPFYQTEAGDVFRRKSFGTGRCRPFRGRVADSPAFVARGTVPLAEAGHGVQLRYVGRLETLEGLTAPVAVVYYGIDKETTQGIHQPFSFMLDIEPDAVPDFINCNRGWQLVFHRIGFGGLHMKLSSKYTTPATVISCKDLQQAYTDAYATVPDDDDSERTIHFPLSMATISGAMPGAQMAIFDVIDLDADAGNNLLATEQLFVIAERQDAVDTHTLYGRELVITDDAETPYAKWVIAELENAHGGAISEAITWRTPEGQEAREVETTTSIGDSYRLHDLGLQPGDTMVDIGANLGVVSIGIAMLYPGVTIHACEILPENVRRMRENVARAGYADRITVHHIGVSNDGKPVGLTVFGSSGGSFVPRAEDTVEELKIFKTTRLATLFEDWGINRIDFLKVDCEGCEYKIIDDMEALSRRGVLGTVRGEGHLHHCKDAENRQDAWTVGTLIYTGLGNVDCGNATDTQRRVDELFVKHHRDPDRVRRAESLPRASDVSGMGVNA